MRWLVVMSVWGCLLTVEAPRVVAGDARPQGEVLKFSFSQSKIFPGTVRDYWIYIPRQYTGEQAACVYVNQDGIQYNAPAVFDDLIAAGEMPITIGVFVMHGRVPAPHGAALDRFNRSYEYDGLGDAYVRFLLEELLPDVETKAASDGRRIKLSRSGNDRAIGGASSGAICAFNAAWERPQEFSRVFSAIGTYVSLRGGNDLMSLVRKYEPRPIRFFLEDGSNDLNIYGGDWWMANQEMQRSLAFAGYEHQFSWGEGGHNLEHPTQVFPDAMRSLWKDWPSPVQAGLGSPQLQEILIPGEEWQLVGDGYSFTEGPATSPTGEVYFNDVFHQHTLKISEDGQPQVWLADSHEGDGQRFGTDGMLYAVARKTQQILKYDTTGQSTVVADGFLGNDLVVHHTGGVYVTYPDWEKGQNSTVMFISPSGVKQEVDKGLKFANGICLSPDQTLLYVADSRSHWVYSYQIQADGTLAHKQKYFHLHVPDTAEDSGVDGLRTDTDGRLWAATRMGLQVCDQAGRVNCIIPTPNGKVANLTFGGPQHDILYAMCGDKVYRRKVKVHGSPLTPHQPASPRL